MKYVDAGPLRKDIERRLKNIRDYMTGAGMKYKGPKYYKAQGKESAYDALLSIIDSLQQEQQEVDLEKEIKRYTKSCEGAKNVNGNIFELDWNGITAIIDEAARHFYELGKNSK